MLGIRELGVQGVVLKQHTPFFATAKGGFRAKPVARCPVLTEVRRVLREFPKRLPGRWHTGYGFLDRGQGGVGCATQNVLVANIFVKNLITQPVDLSLNGDGSKTKMVEAIVGVKTPKSSSVYGDGLGGRSDVLHVGCEPACGRKLIREFFVLLDGFDQAIEVLMQPSLDHP